MLFIVGDGVGGTSSQIVQPGRSGLIEPSDATVTCAVVVVLVIPRDQRRAVLTQTKVAKCAILHSFG